MHMAHAANIIRKVLKTSCRKQGENESSKTLSEAIGCSIGGYFVATRVVVS